MVQHRFLFQKSPPAAGGRGDGWESKEPWDLGLAFARALPGDGEGQILGMGGWEALTFDGIWGGGGGRERSPGGPT